VAVLNHHKQNTNKSRELAAARGVGKSDRYFEYGITVNRQGQKVSRTTKDLLGTKNGTFEKNRRGEGPRTSHMKNRQSGDKTTSGTENKARQTKGLGTGGGVWGAR